MTKVIRRESRKRGVLGTIAKWTFVLFNLLMLFFALTTCAMTANVAQRAGPAADGAVFGNAVAVGAIALFWALGTVILGALTYFTRGPMIVTEETVD